MELRRLIATEDREQLERWARGHAQQAYLGEERSLCRVLGKFLVYVDTRDRAVAPHLMLSGFWEMWVTQAIARHVQPGMHVVDAGAHVGYFSLLLADLIGPQGKLVAFEPHPRSHELLCDNLTLNGFDYRRAVASPSALGTETSTGRLFTPPGKSMSDSRLEREHGQPVRVVSLDEYWRAQPDPDRRIDFVKIDAEGSEAQIWRGMAALRARWRPVVCMEFTPQWHSPELLQQVQADGYEILSIAADGTLKSADPAALWADPEAVHMLWLRPR